MHHQASVNYCETVIKELKWHINSFPLVPHIYTSVNRVSIGSDNGLSPIRHYLNQCWVIVNWTFRNKLQWHYNDVIMGSRASQITSLTIVYSAVYSGADQRKHQSSASLAFVRGIHRVPVNSPHKGLVTRKMFPFDDIIIKFQSKYKTSHLRKCIWKCCLWNDSHFVWNCFWTRQANLYPHMMHWYWSSLLQTMARPFYQCYVNNWNRAGSPSIKHFCEF